MPKWSQSRRNLFRYFVLVYFVQQTPEAIRRLQQFSSIHLIIRQRWRRKLFALYCYSRRLDYNAFCPEVCFMQNSVSKFPQKPAKSLYYRRRISVHRIVETQSPKFLLYLIGFCVLPEISRKQLICTFYFIRQLRKCVCPTYSTLPTGFSTRIQYSAVFPYTGFQLFHSLFV